METLLLNTFVENYKVDGTAYRAMFRVNDIINAELYPNMAKYEELPVALQREHDQEERDVIERTQAFDPSVLFHELQSPLMCEINDNLIEIADDERKLHHYLDMLILPFGKVAQLFYPDDSVMMCVDAKRAASDQYKEFLDKSIADCRYRAQRMQELIENPQPNTIEYCALEWRTYLKIYGECLAALLLTYDIDLMAEQGKRGIVLIDAINESMLYIQYGSYTQAQERYRAWKEKNQVIGDDTRKSSQTHTDFEDCIIYTDKKKLMKVLHSMIDNTTNPSRCGMILTAAYKLNLITRPTFKQFTNSFGAMTKSMFYKYFTPDMKLELCDPDVSVFKTHLSSTLGLLK